MSQRLLTLSLASLLALAGCGAPKAGLSIDPAALPAAPEAAAPAGAAPSVTVAPGLAAPSVRVDAGEAAPAPAVVEEGYLRVRGFTALTRAQLQDDAEDAGYRTLDTISVPSVVGYLRRSSGKDYLLEARTNHLGVKTPTATTYVLTTDDMAIRLWLGGHVNDKVEIRGLFGANNSVTVTFADKAIDLGFLTNWWTKGKIQGTIVGPGGLPLLNVEVKARNEAGYVFLGNTDDTGHVTLKNLTPGFYQVWLSKLGYGVITKPVEVKAHHQTDVDGRLIKS